MHMYSAVTVSKHLSAIVSKNWTETMLTILFQLELSLSNISTYFDHIVDFNIYVVTYI